MKIYFAGSFSGLEPSELKALGVKNKLYSYTNEKTSIEKWGSKGLMLDSGAYSAFTQGKAIDIYELIAFIKRTKPEYAIQLDVIGSEDETWQNYLTMRQELPNILPVIHYKASEAHIERVLNSGADYILLGALVPLTRQKQKLREWLDYLYGKYKLQNYKIHALGVTTNWCLERYPFYSVDSSSALSITRYPASDPMHIVKQKTQHYTELYKVGIDKQLAQEKHITALWQKRGITWEE